MHNQFKKNIKIIQLDSGGEYMSIEFSSFLYDKCISHQKSYPHTPQQNGSAKRRINTYLKQLEHFLLNL